VKYLALIALIFAAHANAQCFGPGGCTEPVTESLLCFPEGCSPVYYYEYNRFTVAESTLPNGFPTMGWSGPCLVDVCPDIKNQAFSDLEMNAKRANRAQRY
jgi:hypothetical protein